MKLPYPIQVVGWLGLVGLVIATRAHAQVEPVVVVSPAGPVRSVAEALQRVAPHGRVVVRGGTYREGTVVLDRPVELIGEAAPVLDGAGEHEVLRITANDVTVRGFVIRDVGVSYVEDKAGIRVEQASGCRIEDNILQNTFFGIYLSRVSGCRVAGNRIEGQAQREAASGNGIHLWYSRNIEIADNRVAGHRDGIYFEWVQSSRIAGNISTGNLRYGLHFMFSDSCVYWRNTFERNSAGVAVMYSKNVAMLHNRIADNWGGAAYGLLLKDIRHSQVSGNAFVRNTVAVHMDGSSHVEFRRNRFERNGWAARVLANSTDNHFEGNIFVGNLFDVTSNSRSSFGNVFARNFWDAYEGYDLDRDGLGDVAFRPVRFFSVLIEQHRPATILVRSLLGDLLDAAERVFPALTPETLQDVQPLMREPRVRP